MLIWFVAIGILGILGIAKAPAILAALSPVPAITYLWNAGPLAFTVIGGAFLAVTGGEAFYADMGHFGPFPIRLAWFGVALPALTLNYFGQGGLLLVQPEAIESPLIERIKTDPPFRIPGTAVVLGRMTSGVPLALTQNLRHNHVLYEKLLLVAVTMTETPRVSAEDRAVVTPLSDEITRVQLSACRPA
jgi:K+ transporter